MWDARILVWGARSPAGVIRKLQCYKHASLCGTPGALQVHRGVGRGVQIVTKEGCTGAELWKPLCTSSFGKQNIWYDQRLYCTACTMCTLLLEHHVHTAFMIKDFAVQSVCTMHAAFGTL